MPGFDDIAAAVARHGLIQRGGFHPTDGDGVPALPGGGAAGTLVMVGNAGPAMWQRFSRSPEIADGTPDALDRWTRRVVGSVAAELGAVLHVPFGGPPYLPFQRWAMRAEAVHPSPIGMLIHPEYGLWHAYRAALALRERLDLPARPALASPCAGCAEKPCLSTCPVGAFSRKGYDVPSCVRHLDTPAGADCMGEGCRARHACPVGQDYRYAPVQAGFHMLPFRQNGLARLRSKV